MVLAATVCFPRPAAAGAVDYIVGLTGPAMIGFPIGCEVAVDNLVPSKDPNAPPVPRLECLVAGAGSSQPFAWPAFRTATTWSVLIGGSVYISTGKDSKMNGTVIKEFDFGDVAILAFEPMVNKKLGTFDLWGSSAMINLAGGWTRFFVYGGFPSFHNSGIKIAPAFHWKRLSVTYNLRIFPDAFTAAEFGAAPGVAATHGDRELVQGFMVRVLW
jgi:hypothetical protein